MKQNIIDLAPQLANILALHPVEFEYINEEQNGSGRQTGFIAQEMEQIFPDSVATRDDGYMHIAGWSKTEAILVKAIQELAVQNAALLARIVILESR